MPSATVLPRASRPSAGGAVAGKLGCVSENEVENDEDILPDSHEVFQGGRCPLAGHGRVPARHRFICIAPGNANRSKGKTKLSALDPSTDPES